MFLVDRNFIWIYGIFFGVIIGDDVSRKNCFIGVKFIIDFFFFILLGCKEIDGCVV